MIRVEDEPLPITPRRKQRLQDRAALSRRRNKRTTTTRTTAGLSEEDVEVIRKGE